MGLIERTLDSGLVLSEYGQDHASLERELRKRDPLLSLHGWFSTEYGCPIWKVVRYAGPDRPLDTVCVWQSERGEPYPLSSGLLNMVDRLDRNTRAVHLGEDEINAARDRELERQRQRDNEALLDDYLFKHGHPVTPRGVWLRIHRDKQRARGKKV